MKQLFVLVVALAALPCWAVEGPVESMLAALAAGPERMAAMSEAVEKSADCLAGGGAFWASGHPALVSEVCGRAGGFMMIRSLGEGTPQVGDVVLCFGPPDSPEAANKGCWVIFNASAPVGAAFQIRSEAARFGLDPLLDQALSAWLFTGELFAALTRRGKTPVMYESIGMYDGYHRMQRYEGGAIAFHPDLTTPPVEGGYIGGAYLKRIAGMLRRIQEEEAGVIDTAGDWIREARAKEKRCYMYSMGHLFPALIDEGPIGKAFESAPWNAGFRRHKKPDTGFKSGEVVVHIGYQHPPLELLGRVKAAGGRCAYISVRPDRETKGDPDALHIDPMWAWPDACVSVAGYDIPILPASGLVNGVLAWALYERGVLARALP